MLTYFIYQEGENIIINHWNLLLCSYVHREQTVSVITTIGIEWHYMLMASRNITIVLFTEVSDAISATHYK